MGDGHKYITNLYCFLQTLDRQIAHEATRFEVTYLFMPVPLLVKSYLLISLDQRKEIERISKSLGNMAKGDITVWFSYPKGSSKQYKCEFNRDTGWESLGVAGFEGVRQVAIDEDWSAIRFRRVEHIKKMKRNPKRALTEKGKSKTQKK